MGSLDVLPLAVTMMAGPQIISAVILITGKHARNSSLAYVASIALAASIGTLGLLVLFKLLGVDSLADKGSSTTATVIQTALIAVLVFLAVRTYLTRSQAKMPKWMATLQEAEPRQSFKLGITLILLMPSDLVIMTTVALHLVSTKSSFIDALPFILATALIAGLPLILYTVFHTAVVEAMPKIRQWMDDNNWLIQIAVYLIFIILLWK